MLVGEVGVKIHFFLNFWGPEYGSILHDRPFFKVFLDF